MVYYLISEGADMNCCSTVTKSPLITLPAYSANYELTSFLIEKGADVNLYGGRKFSSDLFCQQFNGR